MDTSIYVRKLKDLMNRGQVFLSMCFAVMVCLACSVASAQTSGGTTVQDIVDEADPVGALESLATSLATFVATAVIVYAGFKVVKLALRWFGWARG